MKMNLVLKSFVLVSVLMASAQSMAASSCVKNERDIPANAAVRDVVENAGGIDNLEGGWELSGFAAMVKHVEVNIKSNAGGLQAQIKGLDENMSTDFGKISVCGTSTANTLKVNVIDAKATLYMRVVSEGNIQIAQIEKGKVGTFYPFKKK